MIAQSAEVQEKATASAGPAQAGESARVEMRPVTGELQGKLDSKTAKVGDSVELKTRAAVKMADGTALPKGTRLMGRVTDVQAKESGNTESRISILLDRAELKGGQGLAIHSMIQSVEPPASATAMGAESDGNLGASGMGAGGRAMGGGHVGGGGLAGGAVGGVASTTSSVGSGLGSAVGGTARATGQVAGDATSSVGSSVHAVAGVSGGVIAHATGVPGVDLAGGASGSASASGTLFASKKNIHLDSGTQITLGVATAAAAQ